MVDFIKTQPKPLGYIWENSQKMRDLMTRAAIRFIEMNDDISTDRINEIFPQLARKIYKTIFTGPYLGRAKQSFKRMGDEPY